MEEENPIPVQWPSNQHTDPKREKYRGKPGFSWRYPSSVFSRSVVDRGQLDVLADMGGYNPFVGMQAGNYAFGCWYAKTDIIVPSYQSAIDEHPDWGHLHEGLGDWFKCIGDKAGALKAYAEAMKHDSKRHPPSQYWEVLADVRKSEGDVPGAVDAYRKGEQVAEDDRKRWYWDQMAEIYKEQKDWENMKGVYREAICERPNNCRAYWLRLAETYDKCLDWKGQLDVYLSAIVADSDNVPEYSEAICLLAKSFAKYMMFPPAITILTAAMERHTGGLAQYQKELGDTYMAARHWDKARDVYNALLEGPWAQDFRQCGDDLAHAYLALGDTAHALALYHENYLERQAKGDYSGLSSDGAPAYMIAGDFHAAVRLLKADISRWHEKYPDGPDHLYTARDF
jgi:tetratricopeptide (TPR) repeat protein